MLGLKAAVFLCLNKASPELVELGCSAPGPLLNGRPPCRRPFSPKSWTPGSWTENRAHEHPKYLRYKPLLIKSIGLKRFCNYTGGRTEDRERKGLAQQHLAAWMGLWAKAWSSDPSAGGRSTSGFLLNGPSSKNELKKQSGVPNRLRLSPSH